MTTGKLEANGAVIDMMAIAYNRKKQEIEKSKDELRALADDITELADRNGLAAPKSAKTKLLDGEEWEIKVTFGHSTEVVEYNVLKLMNACQRAEKPGLFKKLFSSDVRYSVRRKASDVIKRAPASIQQLFSSCLRISPSTPSVKCIKKAAGSQQSKGSSQ